ncbi:MAG: RrF2 family transcriptional regulator [Pseudobdellovibrio sp.]
MISKLSKKVEYALMALKYFSEQQTSLRNEAIETLTAKQIADATHAPAEVTARVLQVLSSHGILKAEYGVNGGYKLAKDLSQITVHDLVTIVEGSSELAKCLGSETSCELVKNCTILSPVQNLNKKVQNFYKSISLEEVLHV